MPRLMNCGLRSGSAPNGGSLENEALEQLTGPVVFVLDNLFAKFEESANALDSASQPRHRSYAQRILHPAVLCAPFANRTYQKPLGYAGDYEMVNMILPDPKEGASFFAKLLNCWLLKQDSAAAHRNANVRGLECRHVIHAVAGDGDDLAARLKRANQRQLLRRSRARDHMDVAQGRAPTIACNAPRQGIRALDRLALHDLDDATLLRALAFSHRKEHVRAVTEAKRPETRARRIAAVVEKIRAGLTG